MRTRPYQVLKCSSAPERELGREGRAVDAAARDLAREAAQLENGGGREAAAECLVEQQVEVVALDRYC